MALFVIGAAGFGRRIGWKEELVLPPGHKLTFKVCVLASVISYSILMLNLGCSRYCIAQRNYQSGSSQLGYECD